MTSDMYITDQSAPRNDETNELVHVTVENDDAPDECAIFPANASEAELMTNWVTAQDDSFVSLESMR